MHTRRDFVLQLGGLGLAGLSFGIAGCDRASEQLASLLVPDENLPARPPASGAIDDASHLLNRISWGPRPGDRAAVLAVGVDAYIDEQLHPERIDDRKCEWRVAEIETIFEPRGELYEVPVERLMLDLARARLMRAVASRRQLYEVMVEAWTDHFNIGIRKGECRWMKVADDRETIRAHALGNFRDLVRSSLVSPAMLISLDGLDNRVVHPNDKPNENHARELLELHTLGVDGGYSQADVMEAARCLSGWTFTHNWRQGYTARVAFDPARHDNGAKTLLGVTVPAGGGADDLERVLDIVCNHPSTARNLARRICRTFVSDTPSDQVLKVVSDSLQRAETRGEIAPALAALLASDEFRASRGTLLKRPLHFVVSALRGLDARSDCGPALLDHLERMGHAPFQCPTPDGYPTESAPWLGTLLWRWTIAMQLIEGQVPGTSVDTDALRAQFAAAGGTSGRNARGESERGESERGESERGANVSGASASAPATAAIIAHLLGRTPTDEERDAIGDGPQAIALALASPAFQWH